MTWPPRNKGSEEKRYDEDEDGSQEEQIKSENNEDGECCNALLLCSVDFVEVTRKICRSETV